MKNVGAVYTAPAGTLRRNAPNTRNVRCLSRTLPENPGADQSPNFSSAFLSPRTFGRFYTGAIAGEETGGIRFEIYFPTPEYRTFIRCLFA